jgi:hypothetical protein
MRNETVPTEASQQYTAAYAAHYTGHDLPLALRLYQKLLASHPSAREAGYARMQVQNIVNTVVPQQELLDAHMELVWVHFEREGLLDGMPARTSDAGAVESVGQSVHRRREIVARALGT